MGKDFPAFGIWKDTPQSPYEGWEELEKIMSMEDISYYNESEVTYICLDLRRRNG